MGVCHSGAARTAPAVVTSVLALAALAVRISTAMTSCVHQVQCAARTSAWPTPEVPGADPVAETVTEKAMEAKLISWCEYPWMYQCKRAEKLQKTAEARVQEEWF